MLPDIANENFLHSTALAQKIYQIQYLNEVLGALVLSAHPSLAEQLLIELVSNLNYVNLFHLDDFHYFLRLKVKIGRFIYNLFQLAMHRFQSFLLLGQLLDLRYLAFYLNAWLWHAVNNFNYVPIFIIRYP